MLFEELGSHDKVGGLQEYPNSGTCKESVDQVLFECVSYASQILDFLEYSKMVLSPDALETFISEKILDKTAFCLGGK